MPYCNGHSCQGQGDLGAVEEDVGRPSWKIDPRTSAIEKKTAVISRNESTEGFVGICSDRRRKLVLHFDVRNTILVSDSVTHDDVEQALNSFFTAVTWGREEPTGWVWYSDRPSLRAPCPGAVTYYKSRERELVRSPADRIRLRHITGNFTRQQIGHKFRKYFDAHLRLLEWNLSPNSNYKCDVDPASSGSELPTRTKPEAVSVDRKLTVVGANGRLYHYLLPSFIKMLFDLQADGRRFSVILRTYGVDAPKVLDSIAHVAAGNHSMFPVRLPIDINRKPGYIRRQPSGCICCELPPTTDGTGHTPPPTPVVLETDADIYRYLSSVEGVCGFVDDFRFWQEHDYAQSHGKPLWIDVTDRDVQHVFFDDNIRVADVDSIVDVRLFDGDDCASTSGSGCPAVARSLPVGEIAQLEGVCLVQADLLESTSNVDYFIDNVRRCEVNYSAWLQQRRRSGVPWQESDT